MGITGVAKVRRWQWVAIALVGGFTLAQVRQSYGPFAAGDFGETMNDQKAFERSLVGRRNGTPRFKDVIVYPVRIDGESVHLVAGKYYDGTPTIHPDGQVEVVWKPRCYIARIPYQPVDQAALAAGSSYTVVEYLNGLRGQGVSYTYAWWHDARWSTAAWTGGSLVVIGLIWPTLINLLVFGSPFRPREEKGVSLIGVKGSDPTRAEPQPAPADVPLVVASLDAELEAAIASQPQPLAAAAPVPVRQLVGAPDDDEQPGEAVAAGPAKDFGTDEEDVYPTELHGRGRKSTAGSTR